MGIKKFMGTWRGVVLGRGGGDHTLLACFFPGIEKDCCVIRDYHWRPAVKKLFEHAVRAFCAHCWKTWHCHVVLPYNCWGM